jgi:hypothetical protein
VGGEELPAVVAAARTRTEKNAIRAFAGWSSFTVNVYDAGTLWWFASASADGAGPALDPHRMSPIGDKD